MGRSPSRQPNNFYVYEAQQNLGQGLLQRASFVVFILILFVRPLPVVFDYLFIVFKVVSWTSTGKELTSGLSDCAVISLRFVCVPFPYGVWGKMWNPTVSLIIAFSSTMKITGL